MEHNQKKISTDCCCADAVGAAWCSSAKILPGRLWGGGSVSYGGPLWRGRVPAVGGWGEFWVSDESPAHGNFSPESLGGGSIRMLLMVADPDAFFERAVAAGASVVWPVEVQHGWRVGRVVDPFGHHWEIGREQ